MITGFNHNIKYKNHIYHIQTEDSGRKAPHIITHLFVGGNIIATRKTGYEHLLNIEDDDKLQAAVKQMMEDQHKQMLRNLIHGKFDTADISTAKHLDGPAPLNVDAKVLAQTGGSGNKGAALPPVPDLPSLPSLPNLPPVPPMPARAAPPLPPMPAPPSRAPAPTDLASAAAALIGGAFGGPAPAPPPAATKRPAPVDMPAEANLAPEVLAARALAEKPEEKPVTSDTIFGEDLISEKSLDEVILSYLADDGDP